MTAESEKAIRNGLALLVASLRQEVDQYQVKAYLRGLGDIDASVILEAADAHIRSLAAMPQGKRYFPTVADWVASCNGVITERRQMAARQAKALQEDCPDCMGSGWANDEGPNAVIRCRCHTRALQLLANAAAPLKLPALPPSSEVDDAV
jgi:hypothetical protein